MNLNFKNQVIVITGAGKGIGFETAKAFYRCGAKIAVISRNNLDLQQLKTELAATDDRFYFASGDIAEENLVLEFVKDVLDRFKKIDCLVNNAGVRFRKPFLDSASEDWRKVMEVNFGGAYLFSKAVIPRMIDQKKGRIINISSIIGPLGLPELSIYAASKGALLGLTKSLALEFAEYGININAIAPGFCNSSYANKFQENKELYAFTIDRTPLKRWGETGDVANACLFLASDLANFITGETIRVDGGWSAW